MSFSKREVGLKRGASLVHAPKVTDLTPTTAWEEVAAALLTIITTPGGIGGGDADGQLFVTRVEGEVQGDATLIGTGRAHLGYSVEEEGDPAKTAPDATLGFVSIAQPSTACTNNNLDLLTLAVNVKGTRGKNLIVRWWTKYTAESGAPSSICSRNLTVTYDENTLRTTMVRQHAAVRRGGRL